MKKIFTVSFVNGPFGWWISSAKSSTKLQLHHSDTLPSFIRTKDEYPLFRCELHGFHVTVMLCAKNFEVIRIPDNQSK